MLKSFNGQDFYSCFPKDVYNVCLAISRQGFCLTLVGGAVRDYLLTENISQDLDFEIKHLFAYDESRWERMLKRLFQKLSEDFDLVFEDKGLNIFSVKVGDYELEFSSPRKEVFIEGDLSHKNFEPKFISNLEYREAFARRDFTLNSIGIFFGVPGAHDEFSLIDPYNGFDSLKNKVLVNINDDFFKDPVRLLRLIRFSIKLDCQIDPKLLLQLKKFNLSRVSSFYIMSEFKKSKDFKFFQKLFSLLSKYDIDFDSRLKDLYPLSQTSTSLSFVKFTCENFQSWIHFHQELSDDEKIKIINYFGLSQKKLKRDLNLFNKMQTPKDLSSEERVTLLEKLANHELSLREVEFISPFKESIEIYQALISRLVNSSFESKEVSKEEKKKASKQAALEAWAANFS